MLVGAEVTFGPLEGRVLPIDCKGSSQLQGKVESGILYYANENIQEEVEGGQAKDSMLH